MNSSEMAAEDNNMEVSCSAEEKAYKAESQPEGANLETDNLTSVDTSEPKTKRTKQNNESGKGTKGSRAEKLMKCPKCKAGIAPSVTFCKQKNDEYEFNIGLHQDNGDDHTALFKDKLDWRNQAAVTKYSKPCPRSSHSFPVNSVASWTNKKGGFDIELSINISKDKLEDGTMGMEQDDKGMEQDDGDDSSSEKSTESRNSSSRKPEQSNQTNSEGWSLFSLFKRPTPVVKVHCTPTSDTFGTDAAIMRQLENNLKSSVQLEETTRRNCSIIIIFCPVGRSYESEVKSVMEKEAVSSSRKPLILVLMHHTRDPDYSTAGCDASEVLKNVFYVHVFYHETAKGLLKCKQNTMAIKLIEGVLLQKK